MHPQPKEGIRCLTPFVRVYTVMMVFLTLVVGFVPRAIADSTYSYTGLPYSTSQCNGTYTAVCTELKVTGFFTISTPLGANLSYFAIAPTAFSFTDGAGVITLTSAEDLGLATFNFTTDAAGNITAWGISLANYASDCASVSGVECLGTYAGDTIPGQEPSGDYSGYGFNLNTPQQSYGSGGNHRFPGVWVESTTGVPEPSSLVILAFGLLGLLGAKWISLKMFCARGM